MAQLVLTSDTLAGTPATGTLEYNGQFFGTDSAAARAQMQRITLATAVASTSGTSIDFTSIPAWVKRITVMLNGVSTTGTSLLQVQLGDSGGIKTTGYTSTAIQLTAGVNASAFVTSGFALTATIAATVVLSGSFTLTLLNQSSQIWVGMGAINYAGTALYPSAGQYALASTLDRIRLTTVAGTDTFDAGSVNILYEG